MKITVVFSFHSNSKFGKNPNLLASMGMGVVAGAAGGKSFT